MTSYFNSLLSLDIHIRALIRSLFVKEQTDAER